MRKHDALINVQELDSIINSKDPYILIDVRETWEWEIAPFPGARRIPLQKLDDFIPEMPLNKKVIVLCHSGVKSLEVALILRENGIRSYAVRGGIDAWATEINLTCPRY